MEHGGYKQFAIWERFIAHFLPLPLCYLPFPLCCLHLPSCCPPFPSRCLTFPSRCLPFPSRCLPLPSHRLPLPSILDAFPSLPSYYPHPKPPPPPYNLRRLRRGRGVKECANWINESSRWGRRTITMNNDATIQHHPSIHPSEPHSVQSVGSA